jgi:subtilisin family serine protease
MSETKEYIVTLHRREDLEQFYEDMETPGGDLCIPDRRVDIAVRRPSSRNTHYYLTDEEASNLRADPRVAAVEVRPEQQGIERKPSYTQTSDDWDKASTASSLDKNWGLLRCVEGQQRTNWGSNGTANQSGTVALPTQGKNVDVVIVDGMIDPAHPEFAVNADGTGGTRVVQYNWFQHNPAVSGTAAGNYIYTPYIDGSDPDRTDDNNHGQHVAGTVAGNTQGWARQANIYNINPYSTDINSVDDLLIMDYVREFHNNKPVNPSTGRRNPTICNHSWGYFYTFPISGVTGIFFQGVYTAGPFTEAELRSYGVYTFVSNGITVFTAPARYPAFDADMQDAIDDGVIQVGAAGNSYMKMDINGGIDFDNLVVWSDGISNFGIYYHEGGSPTSASNVICVGAVGALANETKASFSNCGPRVDIYAPGQWIMSSLHTGSVQDPRNSSYVNGKYQGTSMASPQVCGVLACALETYPSMTQSQCRDYIFAYSKQSQVTDTGGSYTDFTSLQGSANRYLFYYKERDVVGNIYPKVNYSLRASSSVKYPRVRIRRS